MSAIRFILVISLAATALGFDTLAQPRSSPELSGSLLLTGSSTMAPLMTDVAKRFSARHPRVKIEVLTGGSGRGIDDARGGKASIGMASRALGEKEKDLRGYSVGRDGVSIIVHKTNPVTELSEAQVRAIFTGRVADWRQIGGPARAIVFIARAEKGGTTEVIAQFLKVSEADVKPHRVAGGNLGVIAACASQPEGIGYASVGQAEQAMLAGTPIRLLRVAGAEASAANIRTGDYPITRPLTLVTRQAPVGLARAFIDFAISPAVADLVRKHDFIPYED